MADPRYLPPRRVNPVHILAWIVVGVIGVVVACCCSLPMLGGLGAYLDPN